MSHSAGRPTARPLRGPVGTDHTRLVMDHSPAFEDAPYQVMPGLTVEEFEGLKESIRLNGLLVPIEYDEHGAVLDGHHRLRALRELGWEKRHSRVIRSGLTEADKVAHALAINVHRRHLTGDQRANAVHRLRHAGWSIRRIADETGVSKTTVARDLAKPSQVDGDAPETVTGADGKAYRARRSTKPTTVEADDGVRPLGAPAEGGGGCAGGVGWRGPCKGHGSAASRTDATSQGITRATGRSTRYSPGVGWPGHPVR